MKWKKSLIFALLIICLFSIASVCASDVGGGHESSNIQLANDTIDSVVATEETSFNENTDVITSDGDDSSDVASSDEENNQDKLSWGNEHSFEELQNLINQAGADDEINLTYDYSLGVGGTTLVIDKPLTINGNNHVLDGVGLKRILTVNLNEDDFENVTPVIVFKNIKFINGGMRDNHNQYSNEEGGAIYQSWDSALVDLILINCAFENNGASTAGGAIYWIGNINISDSQFNDNVVDNGNGGAINIQVGELTINNTRFTNNKVKDGYIVVDAIIDWAWEEIYYAIFYFDLDGYDKPIPSTGGAVFSSYGKVNVENSYFSGNSVGEANQIGTSGGAIHSHVGDVTVRNSTFSNNKAYDQYGGAIISEGNCFIYDSKFNDNIANTGGAIASLKESYIYNSEFSNNYHEVGTTWLESFSAEGLIGEIPIIGDKIDKIASAIGALGVDTDLLSLNSESNGGAVYSRHFCHIELCKFDRNHVSEFGGAVYADGNAEVIDSLFTSNSGYRADNTVFEAFKWQFRDRDGGAIHCDSILNITNSSFVRNSAPHEGGAVYSRYGCDIYNSSFSFNSALKYGGAVSVKRLGEIYNSTFNSNQVTDELSSDGGAIYIHEDCTPNIEKCEFVENKALKDGGAIFVDSENSVLTVSGSRFYSNTAHIDGGAFYCRGKTNIYSSKFENNKATGENALARSFGGAVNSKDNIYVENCEFINNHAQRSGARGGAIYTDSRLAIRDSNFTRNSADNHGGAVFADVINDEIFNSIFRSNFAEGDGGAIYMDSESWPKFISCIFEDNGAMGDGGAIYTWRGSSQVKINDCQFIDNAAAEGGAAYVSKITEVGNSIFEDNFADEGDGGALYINKECNPNIHDSKFIDNLATDRGGAIYLDSVYSYLGLNNDVFTENVAKEGGAVYAHQLSQQVNYVTFTENRAKSGDGGALYVQFDSPSDFSSKTSYNHCTFNQNVAAGKGGGIYYDSVYSWVEEINYCTFTSNTGKAGGAIYAHQIEHLYKSQFRGNKATLGDGGAVFIRNDDPRDYDIVTDLDNCVFESNTADKGKGGGICMGSIYDTIDIDDCEFYYNSAGHGGGAYVNILRYFEDSFFIRNKAIAKDGDGGGIYINRASTFDIEECRFEYNVANNRGGAVYTDSKNTHIHWVTDCTFIHNEAYRKDYNGKTFYYGPGHCIFNKGYYDDDDGDALDLCWYGTNYPNFPGSGMFVEYHESANDENHNPKNRLTIAMTVDNWDIRVGNTYKVKIYFVGPEGRVETNLYHSNGRFDGDFNFNMIKSNKGEIIATFVPNETGVKHIYGYLDDQVVSLEINVADKSPSNVKILSCNDVTYPNALKVTYQIDPMSASTYVIKDSQGEIVKTGPLTDSNSISIEGLVPGSYSITISNSQTWNYHAGSDTKTFNITKGEVEELRVVVYNKTYPEDVECIVYASEDGKYNLTVNDTTYVVTVRNGVGYINIGTLGNGTYIAVLKVAEMGLYVPNSNTTEFTVYPSGEGTYFAIDINVTEIDCFQTALITPVLPEDATGNITYYLSNGAILAELPANETFTLPLLGGGYYIIFANYTGDENYASDIGCVELMVNKLDSGFDATMANRNKYEQVHLDTVSCRVTNTLHDNATGTISYYSDSILIGETPVCENYMLRFAPGVYYITAYYSGDKYFNPASANFTFYLSDIYPGMVYGYQDKFLENSYIPYGQDVRISSRVGRGDDYIVEELICYLRDDTPAHDEGIFLGKTNAEYLILSGFEVGDHSLYIILKYYNRVHREVGFIVNFTVCAIDPEFSLNITSDVKYGETPTVSPILSGGSGNISYYLSDGTFLGELSVNENLTLPVFDVGTYVIIANYSGDKHYLSKISTMVLTVNKAQPAFEVDVNKSEIVYDTTTFVTPALQEDATGNISYYLGDGTFLGELPVNETLTLPILDAGSYVIIGNYSGDKNFLSATANTTLTVSKVKTEIFADMLNITYKNNEDLIITVKDIHNNPVVGVDVDVDLNGIKNYTTDEKGQIKVSTHGFDVGTYDVTIIFNGTGNYLNSTNTATVVINKMPIRILADLLNTTHMSNESLLITLKDIYGNHLVGFNVIVDLNGTKNYTTDENGQIKVSTYDLDVGTYDVAIIFDGTRNYLNSSNVAIVIINKTPAEILVDRLLDIIDSQNTIIESQKAQISALSKSSGNTNKVVSKKATKITASKKTFKAKTKTKKYTITLKSGKKAISKVKVTIKVGKKTYTAKTNNKGKATFKLKKLTKKGKYTAVIKFKGNKNYKATSKKVKIVLK